MCRSRLTTIIVCAALVALLPTAGPAVAETVPAQPGPPTVASSWTARVLYPTATHAAPAGKVTGKVRHYTQWSQTPATFLVTDYALVNGAPWVRILLPGRPNGKQGWVREDTVVLTRIDTWVRVSRTKRTVEIFKGGVLKKRFLAAVGTGGTPTPRGLTAVQDKVRTGGLLGPHILVLAAHSPVLKTFAGGNGVVGIHGWPTASVLGQAVSHGCVRMSRTGVARLAKLVNVGTPVEIV